ncbi:MAG: hypothetical protein AAF387_15340 [Pseudomonadota bacterium]
MEDLNLTLPEERRRKPRPLALAPGMLLRADAIVKPIMAGLTHPLRGLCLLILLIVTCSAWTFWTLEYRLAPLHAFQNLIRNEFSLQEEVAALESAHFDDEIARLERDIEFANTRILPGYPALATWLHESAQDAQDMGIIFEYQLSEVLPINGLATTSKLGLAITLKVNVQSADKDGYKRLLQFLMRLDESPWTKEINRASMSAENGGARNLEIGMDIWMSGDAPDGLRKRREAEQSQ